MASFVDTTLREIDQRLSELQEEVKKLESARSALAGTRRGPGRPPGSATTRRTGGSRATGSSRRGRRPGRPRGRRSGNTRAGQALELVRSEPGITIHQIAERLGIEPNYLYRVMPKLVEDGSIRREGQGWHPAGANAPAPSSAGKRSGAERKGEESPAGGETA